MTQADKLSINIAEEFSRHPAGRYKGDGPFSGEYFRDNYLYPRLISLKDNQILELNFDDTRGYDSSFLEEAFGGFFRKYDYSKESFWEKINMVAKDSSLIIEINQYIDDQCQVS